MAQLQSDEASSWGVRLSNADADKLQRGSLTLRHRIVDGKPTIQATFRLTRAAREQLVNRLQDIQADSLQLEARLPGVLKGRVSVLTASNSRFQVPVAGTKEFTQDPARAILAGRAIELRLGDLACLTLGDDPGWLALRQRMWVQVDASSPELGIERLEGLLEGVGLGDLLRSAAPDDIEIRFIVLAMHQYYPAGALEISKQGLSGLGPEELLIHCERLAPGSRARIEEMLDSSGLEMQRAGPLGTTQLSIPPLVGELRQAGAVGLVMGLSTDVLTLHRILTVSVTFRL